jgi:hypothetical protein
MIAYRSLQNVRTFQVSVVDEDEVEVDTVEATEGATGEATAATALIDHEAGEPFLPVIDVQAAHLFPQRTRTRILIVMINMDALG